MKTIPILLAIAAGTFAACDVKVNNPPSESKTTVVNPPGEKVEHKTTIVNPPAEKKVESNTTIVNPPGGEK